MLVPCDHTHILIVDQVLILEVVHRLEEASLARRKHYKVVLIWAGGCALLKVFLKRAQVPLIDVHHRHVVALIEVVHSKEGKELLAHCACGAF